MTPTDPLFASQWHLFMLGNIQAIWDEYDGTGVNVGVYDDGFDYNHEDMAANYDASLQVVDNLGNPLDPFPISNTDGHGTACAGIIGAANNGVGGVGVAFGVTLTGVNIDFDNTGHYGSVNSPDINPFLDVVGQAAANFDITSNSWGAFPGFFAGSGLLSGGFDDLVAQAYETLAATGRGGLGTIVVKAAGNNNQDANGEGLNASRFTITVAATEANGMAASYSQFGANILVAAPAAAVTTDLSDDAVLGVSAGSSSAPAFFDFDNDGDLDLVSGERFGTIRAYANNGSNVFIEVTGAANPFSTIDVGDYSFVSFVDVDQNGSIDLVTGADDGLLRTFISSAGIYSEANALDNPFNGVDVGIASAPAFGDVNGDGIIDLVTGVSDGTFRVFAGDALGGFADLGAGNPFNGIDFGAFSTPTFGDIDGDGDADMVAGNEDGHFATFRNDGSGVWVQLLGLANPLNGLDVGTYSAPAIVDIDGDGDMDVVSGDLAGVFSVLANDGSGAFTSPVQQGYSPGNYTTGFNGTSAATPVVSGVVALMLDANEALGWRDVQNILAASASLTGSAFDDATPDAAEDGVWYANAADTWNGGGYHAHTNYGYGMVNAYNAVRMAEVWHLFKPAQISANEQMVTSGLNDFADTVLADGTGAGFSTTFTIAESLSIEHVALQLKYTSTFVGDLRVVLTSAEGTEVVVKLPSFTLNTNTGTVNWQFGIDSLRGEVSAGTWTMQVFDAFGSFVQTVRDARLDIYGSTASVDDVYHFTDEFLTMKGFDAPRAVIADANGGTDWLNFAAVSGGVSLSLNGGDGNVAAVAGVTWFELPLGIENVVGGDGNDSLSGASAANHLVGMRGNDDLFGDLGNDSLMGGAGRDTLDGGAGADLLAGGTGIDWYFVDNAGDSAQEVAGEGTADRVYAVISYSLAAFNEVEILTTTNSALTSAINLTGNEFAQLISGNAGANRLDGKGGADTMQGLGGADEYFVDNAADVVREAVGGGIDRVNASVNYALGSGQEVETLATSNLVLSGAINLTGNGFAQLIIGNQGTNRLDGGGGADTMQGFAGEDEYFVDNAADVVIEAASSGADRVYASVSYALGAGQHIETFTTTNSTLSGAIDLTGNDLAQLISGNQGANRLDGRGGADTLQGLGGADIYLVDNALDVVREAVGAGVDGVFSSVSYALGVGQEIERLSTRDVLLTDALTLTGNEFGQVMIGNNGANTLDGGAGADSMEGLWGDDRYIVDNAGDVVREMVGGGNDRVMASVNHTLGAGHEIELLTTTNFLLSVAINLTGNEFAQTLSGNQGVNRLDGKGGADTMQGLGGSDDYFVDNALDVVREAVGGGTDRVFTAVSHALGAGQEVESLTTTNFALSVTMNLTGNEFGQTIGGNQGVNTLDGKGGTDTLQGLGGADSFVFSTALGAGNIDTIRDFDTTDTIVLSRAIFAGLPLGGILDVASFVAGAGLVAAVDAFDRIIYNTTTGGLFYDLDGVGGTGTVQFALLQNRPVFLNETDFAIIA